MDPDANLAEQRDLAKRVQQTLDSGAEVGADFIEDAARLAELAKALDEWLSWPKRGALPDAWWRP